MSLHTTPAVVQVKADNPDFKITEIAKHIGELWAKASDKDKEKYQKKADEVGGPAWDCSRPCLLKHCSNCPTNFPAQPLSWKHLLLNNHQCDMPDGSKSTNPAASTLDGCSMALASLSASHADTPSHRM